ncbi:MAG TPA: membrane protein insertion efficiency factor YidD [Candidatus Margulisiibacteriota bacterium]|nr:membrane protein insertion efficiency factor YidD [Candidatus Margulisiibacteriota bacterium]
MPRRALLFLIKLHQKYIRIILPCACRFSPSCSEYAKQAITHYGCLRGSCKAARRVFSCHPWSGKSVYDPLV